MTFRLSPLLLAAAALWLPQAAFAQTAQPEQATAAAQAGTVQATTAAVKAAPPVDLRVTYYTRNIGHDGVQRETTHTNRIYRRTGWVWTEREMPAALLHSESHGHAHHSGPHAGHAHDDATGAPLRVSRSDDGEEKVEIVLNKLRRVIEVERGHQANVGYGGVWDAQYWIVPPASLRAMQPVGAAKNGVQRYRRVVGEQTTVVDWDVRGQYPRLIERSDGHGTALTRVKAERIATPKPAPWEAIAKFDRGDYSDLLD